MANSGLATINVHSVSKRVDSIGIILHELGKRNINLEFIVHNLDIKGDSDLTFCIDRNKLELALGVLKEIKSLTDIKEISYSQDIAILSVFGPHFREKPMISGLMFYVLGNAGIKVLAISTSISSCSCLINMDQLEDAINALFNTFEAPPITNFIK